MSTFEKKKIDSRIKATIENCVRLNHRSLFVLVGGDQSKYQVANLHFMLSKVATSGARPSVLWCYKNELGFGERMQKKIKKSKHLKNHGISNSDPNDPFDMFVGSTEIRYCYYQESEKILGCTFGMCVLQDFEAITPNLLARTIETVQGGGIVVLLLGSLQSLADLCTMVMDVHTRYRTERHQRVTGRFNERFLLSLTDCHSCLVVDDQLNILPLTGQVAKNVVAIEASEKFPLKKKKSQSCDVDPSMSNEDSLLQLTHNEEQASVLTEFIRVVREDSCLSTTLSLTAARGRGKSAALGLCVAASLLIGKFSSVFVTSPSVENLQTFFSFLIQGLRSVGLQEHHDFDVTNSIPKDSHSNPMIIRVLLHKWHRQSVSFVEPTDAALASQAELVVIDEAAAIPLPLVKAFLTPNHLTFLSSTTNGYEGTGRSLSLKLIQQLKENSQRESSGKGGKRLIEFRLESPIRYGKDDPVEQWLNKLLCLTDSSLPSCVGGSSASTSANGRSFAGGCPSPDMCDLYYVNRDALFSYHKASESFLSRLISLFSASHYKNSPNDLQLLSDAPGHHLFVLLAPVSENSTTLPEILCAIQVCLEGAISRESILDSLSRGVRAGGDLIPWTVSEQFQDENFAFLSGARIVRISTNPDFQKMGYGSKAIELLESFLSGNYSSSSTSNEERNESREREPFAMTPRKLSQPLLSKLAEIGSLGHLDWIGVSFGLTPPLLKFWKRHSFLPVYLRQTTNELTGEHSAILLKTLTTPTLNSNWLKKFNFDFSCRFINLLSFPSAFTRFSPITAFSLIEGGGGGVGVASVRGSDEQQQQVPFALNSYSIYDLKRLESYSNNMVDYHLILDLVPHLASEYFRARAEGTFSFPTLTLSPVQNTILLGFGLQHKSLDQLEHELVLPTSQILAMFTKIIKKFCQLIRENAFPSTPASCIKMVDSSMIISIPTENKEPNSPSVLDSLLAKNSSYGMSEDQVSGGKKRKSANHSK